LIENLQREDLNAYEETLGILELLTLRLNRTQEQVISLLNRIEKANRRKTNNVICQEDDSLEDSIGENSSFDLESVKTIENVFALVGRFSPESFRSNRLPLLNLPSDVQQALALGKIEYTKARAIVQGIAKLNNKSRINEERERLLIEAIENNLSLNYIQDKIRKLLEAERGEETLSLKQKYKDLSKQLGSSKVWNNPKKQKTLEKLLDRIKIILADEE
jgi:ParB family chromosome partitioning protein